MVDFGGIGSFQTNGIVQHRRKGTVCFVRIDVLQLNPHPLILLHTNPSLCAASVDFQAAVDKIQCQGLGQEQLLHSANERTHHLQSELRHR
jgi:hypothetical protein